MCCPSVQLAEIVWMRVESRRTSRSVSEMLGKSAQTAALNHQIEASDIGTSTRPGTFAAGGLLIAIGVAFTAFGLFAPHALPLH